MNGGRLTPNMTSPTAEGNRARGFAAAEQRERSAEQFQRVLEAARMSHEIRTPLTAVIGLVHLLEQTRLCEHQRQYLDKIQIAGRALLGVVDDVLDLSKIEAGEMSLESEPFDLPELLRNVSRMLTPQAQSKHIELIAPLEAHLPCTVKGDASRLRQILVNLVSNSIKFTEAGRVSVKVSCTQQRPPHVLLRCEVQDTGIGIPPEALRRLFQPYTQADANTTRRFGGTGLGLCISHSLVQLMGGAMDAISTVGVGSTFWFEIPLELAGSAPIDGEDSWVSAQAEGHRRLLQTNPLEEPHSKRLDGKRVLLVDDSDINLEIVRRILEHHGAIVTCCSDGASAVEHVRARHGEVDVVLIDVHMPILDGNEATRRIRRELGQTTLPIIGLTASALGSEHQRSLEAGMDGVITKPFDPEQLLRKVSSAAV